MLKIKDSVDLKELEKFGFKKEMWFGSERPVDVYCKSLIDCGEKIAEIQISSEDREIVLDYYEQRCTYIDSTTYDLIKADMVEKVEE